MNTISKKDKTLKKQLLPYLLVFTLLISAFMVSSKAYQDAVIVNNEALVDPPTEISFHLEATSKIPIVDVTLLYYTDEIVCQEAEYKAVPDDFEEGTEISTSWEWNLLESGNVAPGALITWQWILALENGEEHTTEEQSIRFVDPTVQWQQQSTEGLQLNWQKGNTFFADQLLNTGEATLKLLEDDFGLSQDYGPIRIYIYPTSTEMQASTLFAPSWSGGLALDTQLAVLAGVGPQEISWGRIVVAHELTHVVVRLHQLTCLSYLPIWFNEGFAEYIEGSGAYFTSPRLQTAIREDKLYRLEELEFGFSNSGDLARLAYDQSNSFVTYLIEEYGNETISAMLEQFSQGKSANRALEEVLGISSLEFEAGWRDWVGASPLSTDVLPTPTRAAIPTIPPIVLATEIIGEATETTAALLPEATSTEAVVALVEEEPAQVEPESKSVFPCASISLGFFAAAVFISRRKKTHYH